MLEWNCVSAALMIGHDQTTSVSRQLAVVAHAQVCPWIGTPIVSQAGIGHSRSWMTYTCGEANDNGHGRVIMERK